MKRRREDTQSKENESENAVFPLLSLYNPLLKLVAAKLPSLADVNSSRACCRRLYEVLKDEERLVWWAQHRRDYSGGHGKAALRRGDWRLAWLWPPEWTIYYARNRSIAVLAGSNLSSDFPQMPFRRYGRE